MHIVIIGNGISGVSCARYIRKLSDHRITIISGETTHFFSRTALMYIYMGHMRYEDTKPYEDYFWSKNKIELIKKWVSHIDFDKKEVQLEDHANISYDVLVLACGSVSNKFGWPGQDLEGVQGLYSYQDLEALEHLTPHIQHGVIVGGGLIGVELAEMLHTREIPVSILIRESHYWGNVLPEEDGNFVGNHIQKHGINLLLNTELKSIEDHQTGKVQSVITSDGDAIKTQFVGLTAGVRPNIDWLKGKKIKLDKGILIDHFFRTNCEDVFAIGDCAQFESPPEGRKPIEQVWYTGKLHGITAAHTICGKEAEYQPGPWFNSAKFFDLEYQTYGDVPVIQKKECSSAFWSHPEKDLAMRLVWNSGTGRFEGINTFGIRMSHPVFDKWLREGVTIDYVISNMESAAFEPEFFKLHFKEIRNSIELSV